MVAFIFTIETTLARVRNRSDPRRPWLKIDSRKNELRYEKTGFLHMRKQRRRSAVRSASLFSHIRIVQSLYYLNPKFQASNQLLWLYSPVSVGPGRKLTPKTGFLTTRLKSPVVATDSWLTTSLLAKRVIKY